MKDLKDLELTSEDFQLLIDGLENLPNKDFGAEIMTHMLMSALVKDDDEREKMKLDRERENKKKEIAKELMQERVRILQGKLFLLKRYMRENELLKEVTDHLNGN